MTRKECLDAAAECVLKDRQNQYGKPENSFAMIAAMWSAYLGCNVAAHDVAAMMALLKIARFRHRPDYADNAVDLAGYAACMIETATAWEREGEDEDVKSADVVVLWKHKPKADSGCCQNGNNHANPLSFEEQAKAFARENPPEEPRFEHGDRVQAFNGEEWGDCRYIRWDEREGRHVVQYKGCRCSIDPVSLRPAPKAEGCEELVQKDAPQTPQELYQHIVDCNPATFGRAHKPTGEELAEMAEEDAHE